MTIRTMPLAFALVLIPGCEKTTSTNPRVAPSATSPVQAVSTPAAFSSQSASQPASDADSISLDDILAADINAKLAKWKANPWDVRVPPSHLRDPSLDVVGEWRHGGGFSGQNFDVSRRADGSYDVDFLSYSCTSSLRLRRNATYQDGILTLDVPLEDERIFKQLYALRVGDHCFLIAPTYLSELERIIASTRSADTPILYDENERRFRRIGYVRAAAAIPNIDTSAQPVPNSPLALYATPAAPTNLATIELSLPYTLTLRHDLKPRHLNPGATPSIPQESMLEPSFDLSGEWNDVGGLGGWHLQLARRADNSFDVIATLSICGPKWQFEGHAHFRNGLLTTDFPDDECRELKSLHAVRVGSLPMLAPAQEVELLLEFATLCEAAHVDLKDHLIMRPALTFVRGAQDK